MNRFDAMDMDLDAIYDDVRVDEENLSFVEEEVEEEMFLKFRNFEGLVYMTGVHYRGEDAVRIRLESDEKAKESGEKPKTYKTRQDTFGRFGSLGPSVLCRREKVVPLQNGKGY